MVGTYACQLVAEQCGGQVTGYFQTPEAAYPGFITGSYDIKHMLALVTPEVTPQNSAADVAPFHFFAIDFRFPFPTLLDHPSLSR
jgi:hypothetical protein